MDSRGLDGREPGAGLSSAGGGCGGAGLVEDCAALGLGKMGDVACGVAREEADRVVGFEREDVDGSGAVSRCGLEYGGSVFPPWCCSTGVGSGTSNSQLKLSRKPSKSVVSDGENRSADEGSGGGAGKRLDSAGSNENSKSANGTGGCRGGACGGDDSGSMAMVVVRDQEESCAVLGW